MREQHSTEGKSNLKKSHQDYIERSNKISDSVKKIRPIKQLVKNNTIDQNKDSRKRIQAIV